MENQNIERIDGRLFNSHLRFRLGASMCIMYTYIFIIYGFNSKLYSNIEN